MENRLILLDTTILIDLFRRKEKENSAFYQLSNSYNQFAVSTITRFEIFVGQRNIQNEFWGNFYKNIKILNFDDNCAVVASSIVNQLKRDSKMIEIVDILIAATAIANNLELATLNKNHFNRIDNLKLI